MTSATIVCPQCSAAIPAQEEYINWCEHCEWNVHGTKDIRPATFLEKFYAAMSRRHSKALFESVVAARQVRPPVTAATVLAFGLAICVHLMTLCVVVGSVFLITLDWPHIAFILLGCCGLGFVWLARIRMEPIPVLLSREKFPAIYDLADTVADALGAKRVDGISINGDFNAAFGIAGWKRKRILYLGLPFWTILDNQEKIDLVAHELAHNINNDYRSGLVVGTAANTLFQLHTILYPPHILPTELGFYAFAAVPFTLASLGLSYIVRGCALVIEHLLWSGSQRAEYYADILAATVAGKKASLGGLEKIMLHHVFRTEVQRMVMQRRMQDDLFEKLLHSANAVPNREKERLRRAGMRQENQMNISHPPTHLRMSMIEYLAPEQPSLLVSDALLDAVQQEMDSLKEVVQLNIIDDYRASIYD